ncbi:MAG: hypothetical protein ABR556_02730 [Pyrinomonadaceae bacterium]
MLKKLSLFIFVVFLTIVPCMPLANAGGKEPVEPLLPRAAFAPAAADQGSKFGIIAKKFVSLEPEGISLVPANPLVAETLETPVLLSLTIPEDNKRTHFLIATSSLYSWDQISSTAPYRLNGSLRYRLTSSALPAPGEMRFGIGLLEGQFDSQPSTIDTSRTRDQTSSFGLDHEVMVFLLKFQFPTLTDEQALQTARAVIKSEIGVEMRVRVRVRSVLEFNVAQASLFVWGD